MQAQGSTFETEQHCGVQWVDVARQLGTGRLAGECLARYQHQLAPAGCATWSAEQDAALLVAMKRHGKNWKVLFACGSGFRAQVSRVKGTVSSSFAISLGLEHFYKTNRGYAALLAALKHRDKKWKVRSSSTPALPPKLAVP